MIVLDTNVISEIFRPSPEPRVVEWLVSLTGDVAITSMALAELLAGVRRLPDGRRKDELAQGIEEAVAPYRGSRSVLAFDEEAAERYAEVLASREAAGAPVSTADAQIAAICLAHRATCATRNVKDFQHTGVELVDPWNVDACSS
ncbi:type II toxin-antitoxin system VapC family toxin [Rhodococcus sp. HNM0563]|uniref:type II toxin-antitoxin system VapC family toxin n=1 Tax=Rhodococcus sp. HNM0563 TaxID=2716339 RepID=UPI00146E78EA|nr:type II toxin-antitoxin system VapC family toxin [Rhodococcus sp. HNM0563]NLU62278.1 type II toxin-antitoxin system VapC family toxin [Rhodococcus sp. HNM0563]